MPGERECSCDDHSLCLLLFGLETRLDVTLGVRVLALASLVRPAQPWVTQGLFV